MDEEFFEPNETMRPAEQVRTMVSRGLTGNTILRFFRFGRALISEDMPTARILVKETIATPDELVAVFENRPRKLLLVERCRLIEGVPRLLEKIWVPLPAFTPKRLLLDRPLASRGMA